MQTTLLIMAAGIGSRFGGGIKQLEPVDEAGHIIMDYSIHDAIEAGFNKVVFIIRKDIEREFKEVIGDRIAGICNDPWIGRILRSSDREYVDRIHDLKVLKWQQICRAKKEWCLYERQDLQLYANKIWK